MRHILVVLRLMMSCRSWMLVSLWLIFLLSGIVAGISLGGRYFAVAALFIVYGLQGFVSEFVGVFATRAGLSAPNRLFGWFPLMTLWRLNIRRGAFDRIDRYGPKAIAIFVGGARTIVDFPSVNARKKFLAYCRKTYPEVQIAAA